MKSPTLFCRFRLTALVAAATAVLLSACVKPAEQAAAPVAAPAPAPEPFAAAPTASSQPPSVAGIPAAAIAAAERAKARVEVASTATVDNGALYKRAQALFAEKKYGEALRVLDDIPVELLTEAQDKAVKELRANIQRAQGQ
jgi:hypothetical protein